MCHRYWPEAQPQMYGAFEISVHSVREYPEYTLREFKLTDTRVRSWNLIVSYCCFYLSSHWPISLQEPCLLSSLACTLSFLFFSFLTVISCMHPLLSSLLSSFCSTLISELNCLALIHLFLHIDNCSSHVAGCRGFLTACETVSVYWLAISRCSQFRCGADWPTRAGWEVAAQLWGQAYHYSLQVCQY